MQKLTNELAAPWFLELWAIASTPAKAGRLRKSTVERLLKQHRIRRMDAETVLRILRGPGIKVAQGVAEAASIHIRSLVARLRTVNRELREAERKLDELCTAVSEIEQTSGESLQRRDVAILRSMPGIGRINLGTLLSEASGPLSRRDYEGLRTLSGAAPVTKRSGKSLIVVRRYAAHVRLRDTVYHWARVATQRDPKCRARYTALWQRGHSHGYEILEERYGRRSTILTSQIQVDKWHDFIGDPTYADAILDRLVHNAHRIDLAGDSLRRRRARSTTKD